MVGGPFWVPLLPAPVTGSAHPSSFHRLLWLSLVYRLHLMRTSGAELMRRAFLVELVLFVFVAIATVLMLRQFAIVPPAIGG